MSFLLGLFARIRGFFKRLSGGSPLCDRCRYDYGSVCQRPERPNAFDCPDYKRG